jgi:hypothetical protein
MKTKTLFPRVRDRSVSRIAIGSTSSESRQSVGLHGKQSAMFRMEQENFIKGTVQLETIFALINLDTL